MEAKQRILKIIEAVKADIAMHERLHGEATTDDGRAYQARQIEICRQQLAKREAMLADEIARNN